MIPFFNLTRQYVSIKKEIKEVINDVFKEGYFILGEQGRLFEQEFARYCKVKYALGVGSGTEALHLALIACGVGYNDEVITVPNTAVPTCSAISFAGAIPVFTDIDSQTYTMDIGKLEEFIKQKCSFHNNKLMNRKSGRTIKAVIPVHLFGQMANMEPIIKLAKRYRLKVIEDCAQAHGAEIQLTAHSSQLTGKKIRKKAGALGDVGCFSFYPTKNLGAYGDGGMVVTNDSRLYKKISLLRNYGEYKRYYHTILGFNSRLDELQAAMLRIKLKYLDKWNDIRRKKAALYNELLKDSLVNTPVEKEFSKHIYHLYVIRTDKRDSLQKYLDARGIKTLIHYPLPVHLQKAYVSLGYKKGDFSMTEQCAEQILSLPIFPELKEQEIKIIVKTIKDFFT